MNPKIKEANNSSFALIGNHLVRKLTGKNKMNKKFFLVEFIQNIFFQ